MEEEKRSLTKKPELTADVIVSIGETSTSFDGCIVYANNPEDPDIVFIAQDPNDPANKIQVTVKKSQNA